MMGRLLMLGLAAVVLGGCATPTWMTSWVPSWVPVIGNDKDGGQAKRGGKRATAKSGAVVADDDAYAEHPVPVEAKPAPARKLDDETVTDRVVAVVNNDAITLAELQESVAAFRQENRGRVSATDEQLSREFLTRLIDTRLQLQEADREKITVDDTEVTEELEQRIKRFGATSMAELEASAKAQGLSMDAIRKRIREGLRVSKVVRRKVALRVSVTEQEIDGYLAQNREKLEAGLGYHARHILILSDGDSDVAWEAARIRAELLREQLKQGADFAGLAREYSRDASAKDGGDLGPLKRGELAQDIEAQILALEPGEVSRPYRSPLGWHIFKLESKEVLEGDALQRARQQVRDILFREKYDARLAAWLREIKDRAIIEVRM